MRKKTELFGVMAEFKTPQELLHGIEKAKASGYTRMDAFTPYPIEKVVDALGFHHTKVPLITLIGALIGSSSVFGFITWASVVDYPLNVGGRPYFSWPAFIPATFEGAVFVGGLSAAIGMIVLNGLPRLYHPVFNVPRFKAASKDGYFLCVEAADPKFQADAVRQVLQSAHPVEVNDVPE